MNEDHIDLGPLDPTGDPERWERRIRSLRALAAPELARRAARSSPVLLLARWARPTAAAAAVLAAVSAGVLALSGSPPSTMGWSGIPEELGLPAPVSDWVVEERGPTTEDLLLAMEGAP